MTVGQRYAGTAVELNGLTQVAVPFLGIQRLAFEDLALDGRVERNADLLRRDARQTLEKLLAQGLDLRRVSRIVDRDQLRVDALFIPVRPQPLEGVGVARQHERSRPVDRRDGHAVDAREIRQDPVLRERNGEHAAEPSERPQRPTALDDDPRRVVERQRAGHVRGRDLTLRVPHHRCRLRPERAPQSRDAHHHREQDRLHDVDAGDRRRPGRATQDIDHRPPCDVAIARSQSVIRRANSADASSRRTPIPTHCDP